LGKRSGPWYSIDHTLDFIERHGVVAAIVEADGAGRLVASHLLGDFKLAAVLQVRRGEMFFGGLCGTRLEQRKGQTTASFK